CTAPSGSRVLLFRKKIQLKWMQSEQRVEEMLKNRAGRCLMNSFYFKPPKSE
uniref:Uncharacterized protein n=1 Tax=Ursus americanus TaxID=9643 RepID=A0A452QA01_URSAM